MPRPKKVKNTPLGDLAIQRVPVADLKVHPDNPRTLKPEARDLLAKQLRANPDMLKVRPLLALPDGTVFAGNSRLLVARDELGWQAIECAYVDIPEERARVWALADNNNAGDWETEGLGDWLGRIHPEDRDLAGFDQEALDRLITGAQPDDELLDNPGDGGGGYSEQYGVIVMCEDEGMQADVFERLQTDGYDVKVVTT